MCVLVPHRSEEANKAFSAAVQMHDVLVKAWAMWGDYLESIFVKERQLHLGVSAITCYLHACRHQNESKSRKYLAKVSLGDCASSRSCGWPGAWLELQLRGLFSCPCTLPIPTMTFFTAEAQEAEAWTSWGLSLSFQVSCALGSHPGQSLLGQRGLKSNPLPCSL